MAKIIHRASSRGHSKYEWLDSKHSFSFASYHNPERIHFGALRVLNDDIIEASSGFGKHPHDNMEIITIPINGALKHQDSMGYEQIIGVNEVQVMSAGSGIIHSEYNASEEQAANFLQLWIFPDTKNITPRYDQRHFDPSEAQNAWQTLVSDANNTNKNLLGIRQKASISRIFLSADFELNYTLKPHSYGCYLFVISGEIKVDNDLISERDALGLYDIQAFKIKATKPTYLLNIEIPKI